MCVLLVMRAMLVIFANEVETNGNPNAHLPQSESILILVTLHSHFYPNVMVPKKGFVNGHWEGIPNIFENNICDLVIYKKQVVVSLETRIRLKIRS